MLVIVHAAATWFLVGLIWVIQLVHYPLFDQVGERGFRAYQTAHAERITWIVGPLMAVELVTAIALVWARGRPPLPPLAVWGGLFLLLVIWGSTAFLQVPLHARLGEGFDADVHRALVGTNWLRTIAWTVRGGLVAWMIASAVQSANQLR